MLKPEVEREGTTSRNQREENLNKVSEERRKLEREKKVEKVKRRCRETEERGGGREVMKRRKEERRSALRGTAGGEGMQDLAVSLKKYKKKRGGEQKKCGERAETQETE